ncbi:hypothetical protein IQ259_19485 [Fortiea sp. LEGE XX443]|uniref:HMA2 domain-containing protein n=1 Tax=Fortiea sp. LEGE XX443 TaxID=1828611 RepID=UPI00187EB356|nr:hypothetical protein [Fortiea sp. LEGE XX443]MBE9007189.1 hypothetical protein [Fortiea sp. LEGE XX443]
MEGSVSSSASQPPGESPWKIAAKSNNATRRKQSAKVAYSTTLALPGKVAFCVPRISDDPPYLQRLQGLIKAQQWVISQQVSPEAGSVVITYKTGMMSDFEMRSELANLLQIADHAQGTEAEEIRSREHNQAEEQGSKEQRGENLQKDSPLHPALPLLILEAPAPCLVSSSQIAYTIVHTIPGRVRFHIPQIACDRQYVQRLENLLKADPVVTSERINPDAASVVITYKTGTLRESQQQKHNVVEAAITHLTSLIQSANETASRV